MNYQYLPFTSYRGAEPQASSSIWTSAKNFFRIFKTTKAFLKVLLDDRGNLDLIEELSTSLVDNRAFELAVEKMKAKPEVAAIIAERYIAPPHDLKALLQYPQDSLGYTYASSLKQAGFHTLAAKVKIDSDTSYVENRWYQTHDIWHIITGFDTSEIGEIGLQAFYLAQFQLPLASMLIANSLIATTLLQPEELSLLLGAIAKGWEMGQTAKPLIAQKWEEAWEKPVAVWRAELNVQPIFQIEPVLA
ncbi:MAG: ubiquinone biosynthesis protein [Mojavia pulchra JT2-VF2]|uniref:Ubiquinone biosynthesis protein n=1 Tax=Mojavia pulchra JT2-VF2 TaxID=287848 RepID=A0A951Q0Q9_9NOST|nr:ubiquinone biosynthesis protein [Mojavia pulchra JT2-VF2]